MDNLPSKSIDFIMFFLFTLFFDKRVKEYLLNKQALPVAALVF